MSVSCRNLHLFLLTSWQDQHGTQKSKAGYCYSHAVPREKTKCRISQHYFKQINRQIKKGILSSFWEKNGMNYRADHTTQKMCHRIVCSALRLTFSPPPRFFFFFLFSSRHHAWLEILHGNARDICDGVCRFNSYPQPSDLITVMHRATGEDEVIMQ